MQEAYCPPRSKYSFCSPNCRGGGVAGTPSKVQIQIGGGTLSQVQVQMGVTHPWLGYPFPHPDLARVPPVQVQMGGGVTPSLAGILPIQIWLGPIQVWGVPYPWLGYPHLDLSGVPTIWTWLGYPNLDLAGVPPSGPDWGTPIWTTWLGYPPPPGPGWGTPHLDPGWSTTPPPTVVDRLKT